MIAPSQTSVLPRRIAASAVDLFLVGFLWLLVLYRLAVRFEIAQRRPDGTPIYADFQLQALAEIREGLNRGQVIGDYYYSLHGRGLVLGILSLLIFSLIAWVLVPANTGWSVGHRAFGLMVTDKKGNKPPLDSYLRRYLVGAVDLFPYVIPGLLGWIVASRNEENQRLGDRSADTLVVDAATLPLGDMPEVTTTLIRPTGESVAEAKADPANPPPPSSLSSMVDLEEALAPHTTVGKEEDYPVLDLEDTSVVPTTEAVDAQSILDQLTADDGVEIDIDDTDSSTGADSGFVSSMNDHEASIKAEEVELEVAAPAYADNWHFPESQDAPVWTPEPVANNGPKAAVLDEHELAEPAKATEADESPASSDTTAGMGDPVWNEEWEAWLYWDAEGKKWLRHLEDKGWVPIGDSQKA